MLCCVIRFVCLHPREAEKGMGDWSLPPQAAETGRRNVGNRKERQ